MSYWTYSDLFEEPGPPPTPFHGGFGLMNREGIRKPAWFAYKYFHALRGKSVPVADENAMVAVDGRYTAALVWDWHQPEQAVSNKPFYTRLVPAAASAPVSLAFAHVAPGRYRVRLYRTGYRRNDPLSAYIDMKMPPELDVSHLARMRALTADTAEVDRVMNVGANGQVKMRVTMNTNDVALVTLEPVSSVKK